MPAPSSEQTVPSTDPAEGSSPSGREIFDGKSSSQIGHLVGSVFFSNDRNVPGEGAPIIGVTAPIHGEGTTTITTLMAIELTRAEQFRSLRIDTRTLEMLLPQHLDNFNSLWSLNQTHPYWVPSANLTKAKGAKGPWSTDLDFRRKVFDELRRHFDNVVIDCQPVRSPTDVALLSSLVDGFILVVSSGGSTNAQLQQAIRTIKLTAGEIRGCCFNRRTYPVPARLYRFFKR